MRPRDINICIGLGNKDEKINLYATKGIPTFSPEITESKPVNIINNPQRIKKILTLSEVQEKYCDPKQEIHFCKIDVEGYEKQVLEGIKDWKKFRPWIFAMEATLPNTNIPCHDQWENILLENDYKFAFQFGVNRYYVDMEKEYLLQGFSKINQFISQNEIVVMRMYPVKFK